MGRAEEVEEHEMDWFRFYHEALDDPKVQMLDPRLFKAWVNLLCIAHRNGGRIPTITATSFLLRMSETDCNDVILALKNIGLLDDSDGTIEPHNWKGRQYQSDSSAARTRKYRHMQRHSDRHSDVTPTVTVTPSETDTESETEAETDTETESETDTESEADKTPSRARRARSSYSTEFEEFWQAYPRRIGKAAAFKAFGRAAAKTPVAEIMAGLGRFVDATMDTDMKFIPHPQTWLNQERWNDDCNAIAPEGRATEANAFLGAIERSSGGVGYRPPSYQPRTPGGNGLASSSVVVTLPSVPAKR